MLDNDEIIRNVGDKGKAKDKGDTENTGDAREVGNAGSVGDARNRGDKEWGISNDGAADRRDQKDSEVGKAGNGKDPEDVKMGNNSVGNGENQDNRHATVENVVDSNNGVTTSVDPIDGILADVLVYLFVSFIKASKLVNY